MVNLSEACFGEKRNVLQICGTLVKSLWLWNGFWYPILLMTQTVFGIRMVFDPPASCLWRLEISCWPSQLGTPQPPLHDFSVTPDELFLAKHAINANVHLVPSQLGGGRELGMVPSTIDDVR